MADKARRARPVVGVALGSGSARGWSHIGVLEGLEKIGVKPQVVAGTSIGALVGAVYVTGNLEPFSEWVQTLTMRDVVGLMDFTLSGGVVKGNKLFGYIRDHYENAAIEDLQTPYASVATDMATGREHWIRTGPILQAARASCALPGVFTPVEHEGRWMLDGGLVNPVPVSTCHALGAGVVIAVNLNGDLVGRHMSVDCRAADKRASVEVAAREPGDEGAVGHDEDEGGWWQRVRQRFTSSNGPNAAPGLFDVMASSVNIMQDRITRSRMAGEPPEVTLTPHLKDFALMDFHRAADAIAEGRRLVEQAADEIRYWAGRA